MSRVLITGASGLLGANLARTAADQHDVVGIYHNHAMRSCRFQLQHADLTLEDTVIDLVDRTRPEWIIHCAAATNVDRCQEDPAMARRHNVDMPGYLARAAKRVGSRMAYISTDSVFDGGKGNYHEEDRAAPINEYAKSKLAGEQIVRMELDYGLVIRTNFYGWNALGQLSLAEWMLSNLEEGSPINGFYDVYFTPILVNDLADVILLMLERELTGVYHVAGSQRCSKYEFGCKLAAVFELDPRLIRPTSITEAGLVAPRSLETSLCTSKITQALAMGMPDVVSGLRRFKTLHETGYVAELQSLIVVV